MKAKFYCVTCEEKLGTFEVETGDTIGPNINPIFKQHAGHEARYDVVQL